MSKRGGLSSPMSMQLPVDKQGDSRDHHDQNPHFPETGKHTRGKDTMALDFVEGLNGTDYIGHVNEVAKDILASPMNGPRRSATGEREAELNKKQGW
jgi:hypothetical protein